MRKTVRSNKWHAVEVRTMRVQYDEDAVELELRLNSQPTERGSSAYVSARAAVQLIGALELGLDELLVDLVARTSVRRAAKATGLPKSVVQDRIMRRRKRVA